MKRIQSLKQVFKGLGISSKNLVTMTPGKLRDLSPCDEEVNDAMCARILKAHGLAEENCSDDKTSFTSLDSCSEADT